MSHVRPKRFDIHAVRLTAEEGFVLSRIDAALDVKELATRTGLDAGRVAEIVQRLAAEGAIDLEGAGAAPNEGAGGAPAALEELIEVKDDEPADELIEVKDDEADASAAAQEPQEPEEATPLTAAEAEDDARAAEGEREQRKIYETHYRSMSRDERVLAAQTATASHLLALCLDPEPQVIQAVLQNPTSGFEHARAIAFHHRTAAGLEMCGRRSELVADAGVQRRLIRNPQLPDALLRKLLQPKPLLDVYRISIDRENPERSRVKVRELLRKKFTLASADERAALLIKTEGRALMVLAGCAFDAHTTQILCGRTTYTVLFVQNIARFSAAPPALLTHLLKQPLVRRNPGLRKMLLQHKNTPAEAKKSF